VGARGRGDGWRRDTRRAEAPPGARRRPRDARARERAAHSDLDTGSYFRPERDGAALVGGHFSSDDPDHDSDGYDRTIDLDWAATALSRAADAATYFGDDSRIRRGWAGLYAVTPDHHPLVEESVPGFVQAVGFSGHGFQHAPATGRIAAELALDGEASLVDIDPLRSDRFDTGDVREEQNVA
jgi:sarcosine oxidase subunit beta